MYTSLPECKTYHLLYDTICERHFKCEDLGAAVGGHVLQNVKASYSAVCHRQNLRGEGNVHKSHIMTKRPKQYFKSPLLGNGVCGAMEE